MPAHYEEVLCDLHARDARDMNRDAAPLAQARDSILLDTSDMTAEQAIAEAVRLIEERLTERQQR
jgi:cytidylate kinase